MAKPSKKALAYIEAAKAMQWPQLGDLWEEIKSGSTPAWDKGKALEHLVVRAFELSGIEVGYPYDVPPVGKPIEQIDGVIYLDQLVFLIECKDSDSVDVGVIAKMRHQLERRPPTTFGCIFAAGRFTESALIVAGLTPPHRLILWNKGDIETALGSKNFGSALLTKYRNLCRLGMTDYSTDLMKRELP
jgi:hypothetical protein